jgi:hypothetical protein
MNITNQIYMGAEAAMSNALVNLSFLDCELTNRLKTSFVKPDEVAGQAVILLDEKTCELAERSNACNLK